MNGESERRFRFEGEVAKVTETTGKRWRVRSRSCDPDSPTDEPEVVLSGAAESLTDALAALGKSLWYEFAIAFPSDPVPLDPRFARLLEVPFQPPRDELATSFAARLGLPAPRGESTVKLLVNLALSLQLELLPPSSPLWDGWDIAMRTVEPAQLTLTDSEHEQCRREWGWSQAELHDSLMEAVANLFPDLQDRVPPLAVQDLSWRLSGA
jgi:hypothetical protein